MRQGACIGEARGYSPSGRRSAVEHRLDLDARPRALVEPEARLAVVPDLRATLAARRVAAAVPAPLHLALDAARRAGRWRAAVQAAGRQAAAPAAAKFCLSPPTDLTSSQRGSPGAVDGAPAGRAFGARRVRSTGAVGALLVRLAHHAGGVVLAGVHLREAKEQRGCRALCGAGWGQAGRQGVPLPRRRRGAAGCLPASRLVRPCSQPHLVPHARFLGGEKVAALAAGGHISIALGAVLHLMGEGGGGAEGGGRQR